MADLIYAGLFAAALTAGLALGEYRARDRAEFRQLFLVGAAGGLIGGKIWYQLQFGSGFFGGGFSIYGFFLGAAILVLIRNRMHNKNWNVGEFADSVAPALVLGLAIHRIGCFFAGCCFGKPTELPWAVTYGAGSPAYNVQMARGMIPPAAESTLPVHPTQLYTSAIALTLFFLLLFVPRFRKGFLRGEPILFTGMILSLFRFWLEFIRDDSGGTHFGPLTFAQASALGVFALSATIVVLRRIGAHEQETERLISAGHL